MSHTHTASVLLVNVLFPFSLSLSFVCLQGVQCGNCPAVRLTEKICFVFCAWKALADWSSIPFSFPFLLSGWNLAARGRDSSLAGQRRLLSSVIGQI
uniref:Putative secreted protein n=1 Tax=Ixodes ricinus TaxID=34613 RepID=A0A6B0U4G3_IXORI